MKPITAMSTYPNLRGGSGSGSFTISGWSITLLTRRRVYNGDMFLFTYIFP